MWIAAIIIWIISALVGGTVTSSKGRGWRTGALLGAVLGLIGLVITLFLSNRREHVLQLQRMLMYRECPHCKEQMRRDATVCPHCRMESPSWRLHNGFWWFKSKDGAWRYLDEAANEWKLHTPLFEHEGPQQPARTKTS